MFGRSSKKAAVEQPEVANQVNKSSDTATEIQSTSQEVAEQQMPEQQNFESQEDQTKDTQLPEHVDEDQTKDTQLPEQVDEDQTKDTQLPEQVGEAKGNKGFVTRKSSEPTDRVLYIVADKILPGELDYFRCHNAKVSRIFHNIDDASSVMIMQVSKCKLVIIESGTGRFTNMTARNAIVDLLGLSSDVDVDIDVFYTDSALKSQIEENDKVNNNDINWYDFKSTPDVLAKILSEAHLHNDNFIYDSLKPYEDPTDNKNPIDFMGFDEKDAKPVRGSKYTVDIQDVLINIDNKTSPAEEFHPKIKPMRETETA